jgi:hypothetical protein
MVFTAITYDLKKVFLSVLSASAGKEKNILARRRRGTKGEAVGPSSSLMPDRQSAVGKKKRIQDDKIQEGKK